MISDELMADVARIVAQEKPAKRIMRQIEKSDDMDSLIGLVFALVLARMTEMKGAPVVHGYLLHLAASLKEAFPGRFEEETLQ